MRTVRVTGKGQLTVRPDTTRITLTLEDVYADYAETLRRSSEDTEVLRDVLSRFGFKRTDLKTTNFRIDTEYENYRDKNNDYKSRFVGYKFTHVMKVEFTSDNDRLGRILYALSNCRVSPDFRISYTVKDQEAVKNTLLGNAVSDAKEKASVLTKAGGVKLGDIQSIDYSWGEISIESRPMSHDIMADKYVACEANGFYDIDIEPDDIDVSDTVTVIWEIA